MEKGTGTYNGKTIPAGGLTTTARNGDVFTISGSAGAKVSVTNKGANNVHADCSLGKLIDAPNAVLSLDF
jgi:hypothetical protein